MADLVQLGFKADSSGLITAKRNMEGLTDAGGRADKQMSVLTKTLGLVGTAIAAVGVTASTKQIIDYADSWSNVTSQLRQVTDSEDELIKTRTELLKLSKDTRSELSNTVELYAEMTRGTSELNISSERLMGVTKTLNNLFVAGGKPISEASGAIRQLNQGFAAGALRGDEFNSVAEGAPKVLDALASSLNMGRGELRAFAATGGITAEIMVKALEEYKDTAQGLADQTAKIFGQNLVNAKTNVEAFVGNSASLNSAVGSLGQGIEDLSENLDALSDTGLAVAGVVGVALTPAAYKYAASVGAATLAQITAVPAATGMSAALGVQATKLTAAAVAANTLGVATRFMLGPWGLAVAAIGAGIATFQASSSAIDKATESAEKHAQKIAELEQVYSKWSQSRLEEERNKLLERSNEILFERLDIEQKIEKLRESAYSRSGLDSEAHSEILKLREQLAGLAEENKKVDEALRPVLDTLDELHPVLSKNNTEIKSITKSNADLAQSYNEQILGLQHQKVQLQSTSDEFEVYSAVQRAIAYDATPAMIEQIEASVKAIQEQRKELEMFSSFEETMQAPDWLKTDDVQEYSQEMQDLINGVDDFGGAWTRTGNVVVDAFGDMGAALGDYIAMNEEFDKRQKVITAESIRLGEDNEQVIKQQMKLNEDRAIAEVSSYKTMAGAASDMFSEKTAAAKAFEAVNKAMAVAEIAMSLQRIASSNVETATTVANEGVKQAALGTTAIINQGTGDPYTAFARIAAMTALVASIIGSASGGGSSSYEMPEEGGTGTVLGDSSAQSNSINNALEDFEDVQIDQLAELRGIRSAMTGLSNGISQLASQFAQGLDFSESGYSGQLGKTQNMSGLLNMDTKVFSGVTGGWLVEKIFGTSLDGVFESITGSLFGSTKKKLVDSGLTFMSQTLGEIFDTDNLQAATYGVIEKTKKSFFGLSKSTSTSTEYGAINSAITEQMADIFGFIGDSVVGAAELLGLDASHIITTGLEQTLGDALSNFQVDIGDVSFLDKTGEEIEEELNAIFSQQADLITQYLAPSMAEYQEVGEGLFETLARVAYEQVIFNDSLERTGMALSDLSSAMQIDIAQSIINMIGGAEEFSNAANSYFENFYSESEQFEYLGKSLGDVFDTLGVGMVDTREGFKQLVESLDLTNEADQRIYATLLEINPSMSEYLDYLEDAAGAQAEYNEQLASDRLSLEIELLKAQGDAGGALALIRERELAATDESLHSLLEMIYALEDAAKAEAERAEEIAKAEAIASEYKSLNIQLLQLQGESEKALLLQREMELKNLDKALHAMQLQIWAQQDLNAQRDAEIDALNEQRQLLEDNVAFAEQQLERARDAENDRLDLLITNANAAYTAQLAIINAQRNAYNSLLTELKANLSNATSALEASRSAEIARINAITQGASEVLNSQLGVIQVAKDAYNTLITNLESRVTSAESAINAALNAELSGYDDLISTIQSKADSEIDAINKASSARISGLNSERSILESLANQYGAESLGVSASEALAQARAGNFEPATNIATGGNYKNAIDAAIGAAREAFALSEIGRLAGEQLSDTDKAIAAANNNAEWQINAIEKAAAEEVAAIEAQKEEAQKLVGGVLGVDDSVMSLADAIKSYQDAQADLDSELAKNTLDKLEAQESWYRLNYEYAVSNAADELAAMNAQVDAVLGVDDSVLSLAEAIAAYQEAQSELDKTLNDGTLERLQSQEDIALEQLTATIEGIEQERELMNQQVDELLNIDNSVLSIGDAIEMLLSERQALEDLQYDKQLEQIEAQYSTNEKLDDILTAITDIPDKLHQTGEVLEANTYMPDRLHLISDQLQSSLKTAYLSDVKAPIYTKDTNQDSETANEIKALRKDLDNANQQIAANTAKTANSVRQLTYMR